MSNTTNDPQEEYKAPSLPAVPSPTEVTVPGFGTERAFDLAQREAKALCASTIVPKDFQGMHNVGNCIIALDMAHRSGLSPMLVMQNLYIVHGRAGWSAKALIALVNNCGRFTAIRYEEQGEGQQYRVRAYAIERSTGDRLDGTWITWALVKAEGWDNKAGSKWKSMPDQMFRYRAAAFWVSTYAPDISMGLMTAEEVQDISPDRVVPPGTMTIRWSAKQMQEAKFEVETMGKSTAQDILDKHGETMPEDQRAEVATWEYKGQ
jgi:hypothetical protein